MQYVITDYGAESGGKTLCTAAVQAAVDACAADGGGTVVVPAGTFLIGTVWLKSRVELHLQHGAVLKASADLADYNDENSYPQNFGSDGEKWCGKHLIIALEQTDVAVTGDGTIEGCADTVYGGKLHYCSNSAWREGYYLLRDGAPLRPGPMVCFVECDRVRVTGVTLRGATCWNLLLHGCYYATLTGLTIRGDKQHVNTDGVDLDTCRYVTVSDCIIDTGDDALAIRCCADHLTAHSERRDCAYITVTNCILSTSACSVRFGVGNGSIHHVQLSDLTVPRTGEGLTFMTGWGGALAIHDVTVHHVLAEDSGVPFQFYGNKAPISRVTLRDCCLGASLAARVEGDTCDLRFADITLYDRQPQAVCPAMLDEQRGDAMILLRDAKRISFERVRLFGEKRERGLHAENCTFDGQDVRLIK